MEIKKRTRIGPSVPEDLYRVFKAEASLDGKNLNEAFEEAMRDWIASRQRIINQLEDAA